MSRATSIVSRLNSALRKVGPQARLSYKRVTTRTGGDDLIGRPGSITVSDTLFDPQPQFTRQARFIVGVGAKAEDVDAAGTHGILDQYMFVFSPDSIALSDLENEDMVIVLKDVAGKAELFDVTDYEPIALNGVVVMYTVFAKSLKRP
jgi:hypothetical protein